MIKRIVCLGVALLCLACGCTLQHRNRSGVTVERFRYKHKVGKMVLAREDAMNICSQVLRSQFTTCEEVEEACLMLMDVKSGNVLAAVDMIAEKSDIRIDTLNRGLVRLCEPGPVFETATLAALLSDGSVRSPEDKIPVGNGVVSGTVIRDERTVAYAADHRTDSISVLEGFRISSNYVFASLAVRNYGIAGSKSRQDGFDKTDRFLKELTGYFAGVEDCPVPNIPTPSTRYWSDTDLGSIAYGYSLELTPLHVLTFYNALANGGKGASGRICTEAVADTLIRALKESARAEFKTPNDAIAGKAGNSFQLLQNHQYEDAEGRCRIQRTFVGFFPAEDPQYSFICVARYRPLGAWNPKIDLPGRTIQSLYDLMKREIEYWEEVD